MRFSDPYWLVVGLLACAALIAAWRWYDRRQQAALARFVAPHLRERLTGSVSGVRRILQRCLFLGAALTLCAALAGPQLGYHWERIVRRGNEVIFALDTSRSMLTPDVRPNRLTRAKLAIDDMARQLEGDGIGIVAFAGSAFLVCPLTLDAGAFHESLDAVDVHTIPVGGTNIPGAIQAARAALRRHPGGDRILILVTDGENLEGDALAAAQQAAQQEGLKIYTVGVGTAAGDLIPLPADLGGGFVKDEKGVPVKSQLDEKGLRAIAAATGGAYVHLGGETDDFEAFLRTVFGAVAKHDLIYRQQKIYTERYQWPLAASVVLLLASLLVGTRRSGSRRPVAAVGAGAAPVVLLLLLIPPRPGSADQAATRGGGAADTAAPLESYNAGTSAYRAGQFPRATQAFEQSIKAAPASDAKRLADQQDAYYNLGNALYRAGQQVEKSAPQEAIRAWTDAVRAYDTALQLRADDADSRYNRDFVKRRIDALRQPPPDGGGGGGGGGAGAGGAGGGEGRGQPPAAGDGRGQGQPPPPGNNQRQGQPPPQAGGQGPGQVPPAGQAQGQTSSRTPLPPAPGQPTQAAPGQQTAPPTGSAAVAPGSMSPEEARELLDSAKADEHHSLGLAGPRNPDPRADKPRKDW